MTTLEQFDYRPVLTRTGVPEHLHDGLADYLLHGCRPGSFLTAVLSNDLREAVKRGDPVSLAGLPTIVRFLYGYAPALAWGSPDHVAAWEEQRGLEFQP